MEIFLSVLIGILILIIFLLILKVYLLRKSIREIEKEFSYRIKTDTNTLIDVSSHDRQIKKLAESINTQLRELRKERHHFQQGDFELKEAVTNISHDLRTPLTAICGYLDLLESEEKSEEVKRYLNIIKNRTEILKQLTEELFRYSVFVSVSNNTSYESVVLNSVLEESILGFYADLKSHMITPEISIPDKKIKRNLNKNALSRIFGNIISNAIKYSDGDLSVTLYQSGEIVFSNSASKLDEIQVGKLFDRFYTVDTAKKSTGLGLSIAKALTEQMNGSITACFNNGTISIRLIFPE